MQLRWTRRGALEAILVLALAIAVVWFNRTLQIRGLIGLLNDDGLYALYGKALALGRGYIDLMEPGHHAATRYPIGMPALIALIISGAKDTAAQVARLEWLPCVAAGLYAVTIYLYVRGMARWPFWAAAATSLLVLLHPAATLVGHRVMAEMPFAILGVAAIVLLETAWKRDGTARPSALWWLAGGAAIALACLFRYAGVTLILAVGLATVTNRRWKGAWLSGVGFVVTFAPWLLYRATTGGESYVKEFGNRFPDTAALIAAASNACGVLLAKAIPSVLLPPLVFEVSFAAMGPAQRVVILAVGSLFSIVVLFGTIAWLRRPAAHETPLPAALVLVTLPLALGWQLSFLYLGAELMSRLLVPVAPFIVLAFVRGVRELAAIATDRPLPWRRLGMGAAVVAFGVTIATANWTASQAELNRRLYGGPGPQEALAAIRAQVPTTAAIMTWNAPLVTFYTERYTIGLGLIYNDLGADGLLAEIAKTHPQYVLGWPFFTVREGRYTDLTVGLLNALQNQFPGVLEPVWVGERDKRYVLFRVNHTEVQRILQEIYRQMHGTQNAPARPVAPGPSP